MIERFDHAVIAVPDLDEGMAAFERLGFDVSAGGRHPSLGTRNAIVRFGLDYLELLSVEHPELARSRGPFGEELVDFLRRDSGLVGFVLAGSSLDDEVEGLASLGLEVEGPFEMERIHARGARLEWRLVLPGGSPWRKPWPYLIDWITPETELLSWDPPGTHDCGVIGVAGMELLVADLPAAGRIYEEALGLGPGRRERSAWATGRRRFRLAGFGLGIHLPGEGAAARELERRGPGPFRLVLASHDLAVSARVLARNGVPFTGSSSGIDIDPEAAMGARLRIVPR